MNSVFEKGEIDYSFVFISSI